MNLNKQQVENLILSFFIFHGKFPPGTTATNWKQTKMSDMQFDDPPLPGNPDFEKQKLAVLLQQQFNQLGLGMISPLDILKDGAKTMQGLADFCFKNQSVLGSIL
jgi:hypothetical protein